MTQTEIEVTLGRFGEQILDNIRRIEALEGNYEAIHEMAASMRLLAAEQRTTSDNVKTLTKKVENIEMEPGHKWRTMGTIVATAALSGLIGYLLAAILH